MKKEIIYFYKENSSENDALTDLSSFFYIHRSKTVRHFIIQLIENPQISGVVVDPQIPVERLKSTLEKLHYLNPALPIVILSDEKLNELRKDKQLFFLTDAEQIKKLFEANQLDRRQFIRTQWPIKARFFHENYPEVFEEGLTLSLSANGVFIKAKASPLLLKKNLYLSLEFEEFSVLTQIDVLRIHLGGRDAKEQGFAATFVDITQETQEFLDSVLKDRIMKDLLDEMATYEKEREDEIDHNIAG